MSCELWQAVLVRTVADAVLGVANEASRAIRVRVCAEARNYLTKPSHDLAEVCALANMDMNSVIEQMRKQIAKVPSPEELADSPRVRVATLTKAPANSRCRVVPFKDREFTIHGEVKTASEWCKRTGISLKVARTRLNSAWGAEGAFFLTEGQAREEHLVKARQAP
jgi:hypothetical protein